MNWAAAILAVVTLINVVADLTKKKKEEEEEETLKQTQLSQVDLCLIIRMSDSALTYKLAVSALQPTKTKYYSLTTYQLHPVRAIKIWSYEGGDRTGRR